MSAPTRQSPPEDPMTTSSSSDDDATTDSSSSLSSSMSSDTDSDNNRQQAAAPPANGNSGVPRMRLNSALRFERPDNEYIPLPSMQNAAQVKLILQRLVLDRRQYPEGSYRMLDYFRTAAEMFIDQVIVEYDEQRKSAMRAGRAYKRFTWKNKGELAICFACCCDTLKLLYDTLLPSPLKPMWDVFVDQLAPMLIAESHVPTEVLSEQTYRIKYMDWQKGGTRYGGEQSTANVRFPSAQERRIKIETYLRSRAGYKLETVTAASPVSQPPPTARTSSALPPGTRVMAKTAVRPGQLVTPFAAAAPGPGPVRPPAKGPVRVPATSSSPHPPTAVAAKQMPEEMRHLYWLSVLAHVKGGDVGAAFPDDRVSAMPGILKLCELTEHPSEMRILVDIMSASSSCVQIVFEKYGGMVHLRRFADKMIRLSSCEGLAHVVERIVHMQVFPWSAASHRAWRTNGAGRVTSDLGWLREEPIIPQEKRAAWGALILVMEEKYIFRPPRIGDQTAKRPRSQGSGGALPSVVADNIDFQSWKLLRVNMLGAMRLPAELRAPPFSSELEERTLNFLQAKKAYAEAVQELWSHRIKSALRAAQSEDDVVVPLWYDPFQLLGVNPVPQ